MDKPVQIALVKARNKVTNNTFSAFQWDGNFTKAWAHLHGQCRPTGDAIVISNKGHHYVASLGQWVLIDESNEVFVHTDEYFKGHFSIDKLTIG